jgi:hypothetical protein
MLEIDDTIAGSKSTKRKKAGICGRTMTLIRGVESK